MSTAYLVVESTSNDKNPLKKESILRPKLDIDYYPEFIPKELQVGLQDILKKQVEWTKPLDTSQRSNQIYGDPGLVYDVEYYGKTSSRSALPWERIPILSTLRDMVAKVTGCGVDSAFDHCLHLEANHNLKLTSKPAFEVSSCIFQYYAPGAGIKPHKDKEIPAGCKICGLSFGPGILTMVPPQFVDESPLQIYLASGSLYILNDPTNLYWLHSIEPVQQERISATFRTSAVRQK